MAAMNRREFIAGLIGAAEVADVGSAQGATTQSTSVPNSTDAARFDRAVWRSPYAGTRVWGYVERHSVQSGEPFKVMLSTGPDRDELRGIVEVIRVGEGPDGERRPIWSSGEIQLHRQSVRASAAIFGVNWPQTIDAINTTGWPSAYYTIDFVAADGSRDLNLAYIVVTNPVRSGDVLVVLGTNTYQAYNAWGGVSLYESAFGGIASQMISFDRPPGAAFFDFDCFLVAWLERLSRRHGFKVDYATNFDLHRDASFAEKTRVLLSGSHNEYWSKQEFDHVYRRIFDLGKNALFLGANAAYWQIRYADVSATDDSSPQGRQLVCCKSLDDPIRWRMSGPEGMQWVTARYRDGARRPETMLTGAAYQSYFEFASPNRVPFRVVDGRSRLFAGTGLRPGDKIADVVGYEWDNIDPEGDGRRLFVEGISQIPILPKERIEVLLEGDAIDINGQRGLAQSVYFESPKGGKVFTAGSIRWSWGLGKAGFESDPFKKFNENLLLDFLS
jgi:hypothetical protein